ncbi:MAG: type II toxin-antitoxin system VapB family antitoxin [Planctomycetota bacterium]|nr:type II toxin-antitoxin system VapB family antitoxin [Planctomycetota bacterium]
MRTTLNLDDAIVRQAQQLTGVREKTWLVHEGLRLLVAREAARRLAALGGTEPGLVAPPRRRTRKAG